MHATQIVIMIVAITGLVIMGVWAAATDFYNARRK